MENDDTYLSDETLPADAAQTRADNAGGARSRTLELQSLSQETTATFASRYGARRHLGEGGMGEVLLVRDLRVGRDVAMKVIRSDRNSTPTATHRFIREARVQGQLEHPSIVPVHDLGVGPDGEVYFVMKRIRGKTLGQILRAHQTGAPEAREYPLRKLLNVIARVCLTMDFAHRHDILHRDLKPDNIMLGAYGEVYVLDWGIAKIGGGLDTIDSGAPTNISPELDEGEGLTRTDAIVGTLGYAAPEQVRGEALDQRADVHAMGAILFEVLAGESLFARDVPPMQVVLQTTKGVDARPSQRVAGASVAPELDAVCVKATATNPEERYVDMRELHDAIESYLDGVRDTEMRKEMADAHEEAAIEAAQRALAGGDGSLDHRRRAMREVGRALALRPGGERSIDVMVRLMTEPPAEVPAVVREELDKRNDALLRFAFRSGAFAYGLIFLTVLLGFWTGIRRPWIVVAIEALLLGAVVVCVVGSRGERVSVKAQYLLLVLTTMAYALCTRVMGPFVMIPAAVAVNTFAFAFTDNKRRRLAFVSISSLAVLGPFLLELAGVLRPSYIFAGEQVMVLANVTDLPEIPTTIALIAATLLPLFVCAIWAGSARDRLTEVESSLELQSWQLRQTLEALDETEHS